MEEEEERVGRETGRICELGEGKMAGAESWVLVVRAKGARVRL